MKTEILSQLDAIHAEAIEIAEDYKMFNPDAVYYHGKHQAHIASIVKLRSLITKAIDNIPNVTNDEQGDYYQDGHEGFNKENELLINAKNKK